MNAYLLVLLAFLCMTNLLHSEETSRTPLLALDQVMTKDQQTEMGIEKLSSEEKKKLEYWLSNFALRMLKAGADIKAAPNGSVERPKGSVLLNLGGEHWVKEKIDSGAMISLEDGSLWQISSIDKINTMLWLPTEEISVVESKNPLYPYTLVNKYSKNSAEAKFLGKSAK